MTYFKYEEDCENGYHPHTAYSEDERLSLALTYLIDLDDLDLYEA